MQSCKIMELLSTVYIVSNPIWDNQNIKMLFTAGSNFSFMLVIELKVVKEVK